MTAIHVGFSESVDPQCNQQDLAPTFEWSGFNNPIGIGHSPARLVPICSVVRQKCRRDRIIGPFNGLGSNVCIPTRP